MENIFIIFRLGFPQIMKLSKSRVETGCFASSPRQVSILIIYPINQKNHKYHSSDRKCTLKLLAYFVFSSLFFLHFMFNRKYKNQFLWNYWFFYIQKKGNIFTFYPILGSFWNKFLWILRNQRNGRLWYKVLPIKVTTFVLYHISKSI